MRPVADAPDLRRVPFAGHNEGVEHRSAARGIGPRASRVARLTLQSAWLGLKDFYLGNDLTFAASIAYYSVMSLFPLFLLAFVLLGRATADVDARNAVLRFVLEYFPTQFAFIKMQLDAFRDTAVTVGVAGTVALVWGALGVFEAISTAVNYAWGVEQPRSFLKQKLLSFLMLLVAGLVLLVAILLVSASRVVDASWFSGVLASFPGLGILRGIAVRYAITFLFILVVGFVYYFVPNADVRLRDVWTGAVLTGLLWKGALELFAWFIQDMTAFTRLNGSIAAVVLFLVWVYVQAAILLYGAEFTAEYSRLRRGPGGPAWATRRPSSELVK